ncbi:Mediator of RNA polymerase II transcription subunit 16 [Capsicum chinense]|nr:Mediator of RNA polymerase II transcription subunit 16 [Capsicum chinense]
MKPLSPSLPSIAVAWCGKLNAIACASETCARIPSSNANPPFWIPIHIVIPERPTECTVFNVIADSPRDSVQFIEWSPTSCPRALLIANFHGRITVWTQPSQFLVRVANLFPVTQSHTWVQLIWFEMLVVGIESTNGVKILQLLQSGYQEFLRWLSTRTGGSAKSTFEEKFLSQQPQSPGSWMAKFSVCMLCLLIRVCSAPLVPMAT